jgi:hypothetical protein
VIDGGEFLLIDESYNANPASMAATLKSLGAETDIERRIAVLGPMRELGEHSDALHAGLARGARRAGRSADPDRRGNAPARDSRRQGLAPTLVDASEQATTLLCQRSSPGDALLVKASELLRGLQSGRPRGRRPACSLIANSSVSGRPNLIRYISFRAGAASATALLIGLLLGPWFISYLRVRQARASRSAPTGAEPPRQARHADHGRAS